MSQSKIIYKLASVTCVLIVFSGCASRALRLYPVPSSASDIDYLLEKECLFSYEKASTVVVCDAIHNDTSEFVFYLAVKNESSDDFIFKPSTQVMVDYREDSGKVNDDGTPIHHKDRELYTYRPEQYIDMMKTRAQTEVTTAAIIGTIAAINSGKSTSSTYTSASANVNNSNGTSSYATGQASSTTTSTNAVAQQMALDRTVRTTNQLRDSLKAEINQMSQAVFPRNKIRPGITTDGLILVDDGGTRFGPSENTYLVIYVDIEGEQHTMYFSKVPSI
jgi:hypothetical protein